MDDCKIWRQTNHLPTTFSLCIDADANPIQGLLGCLIPEMTAELIKMLTRPLPCTMNFPCEHTSRAPLECEWCWENGTRHDGIRAASRKLRHNKVTKTDKISLEPKAHPRRVQHPQNSKRPICIHIYSPVYRSTAPLLYKFVFVAIPSLFLLLRSPCYKMLAVTLYIGCFPGVKIYIPAPSDFFFGARFPRAWALPASQPSHSCYITQGVR